MGSSAAPSISVGPSPAATKWFNPFCIDSCFLANGTLQLLAKLASVLVAVIAFVVARAVSLPWVWVEEPAASGDVFGTWYEIVLLRLATILTIPSDIDPSGDGVLDMPKGFPSPEDGGEETKSGWSVSAVVGGALAIAELVPGFSVGCLLLMENRDVVEIRDARDPGRRAGRRPGTFGVADPTWCVGDGSGGDIVGDIIFDGEDGTGSDGHSGVA